MTSTCAAATYQPGSTEDELIEIDQILYCSLVKESMSPAQIDALIASSVSLNRLDGITGLLMYDGRSFLQLIEGPPESVSNLWRRLLNDRRHFAIVKLYHAHELETRTCFGWEMRRVDRRELKAIIHSAKRVSDSGGQTAWAPAIELMDRFLTLCDGEEQK
jgi:hypothetical protein